MNIARLGITTSVPRMRNGHWRWATLPMKSLWFRSVDEAKAFAQRYSSYPIDWVGEEALDGLGYHKAKFTRFPLEVEAYIIEQAAVEFHDGSSVPLPDPSTGDDVNWSCH